MGFGHTITSNDIDGDFCICCWIALIDTNWCPSYRRNGCKKCNTCRIARNNATLPPPYITILDRKKICIHCDEPLTDNNWSLSNQKDKCFVCYTCHNKNAISRRTEQKNRVLTVYGGRCKCCGLEHPNFLNIDHINGDGAEHRKSKGSGVNGIYSWLENNGYPKENFRILCWSCNSSFGMYGYCPHNTETIPELQMPVLVGGKRAWHHDGEDRYCRYCEILLTNINHKGKENKCIACTKKINAYNLRQLKIETMEAYGGQKCVCCDDTHIEFLSIDHIYGGGNAHRANYGDRAGSSFYAELRKAGYPDKELLQVLCINCNSSKGICKFCPHEEERKLIKVANG